MLIRLALFRSTESLFMFSSLSFLSLGHDFIVQISFLYWCSGFLVGLVPFFLYNSRWVCSRYIPFFGSLFYLFSLLRVCSWIIPYSYVLSLLVQVSSYYLTTFLVLSFFLVAATLGGQVPMTLPSTYQRFHVFRIIPHSYVLLPLIWVSPYCLTIFLDPSFWSPVIATLEGQVSMTWPLSIVYLLVVPCLNYSNYRCVLLLFVSCPMIIDLYAFSSINWI